MRGFEYLRVLQNAAYPNRCLFCGESLPSLKPQPLCVRCARRFLTPAPIPLGLGAVAPDGWAAVPYTAQVRNVVRRFKFSYRPYYARPLALLLCAALVRAAGNRRFDGVTWIPVSLLRRLRRGYDQSRLLACHTARELALPLLPTLRKVIHNPPQSQTPHERRGENVRGAYRLRGDRSLDGLRLLLIDDVCTTGATMTEAASILRAAGAEVTALCFAKAGGGTPEASG